MLKVSNFFSKLLGASQDRLKSTDMKVKRNKSIILWLLVTNFTELVISCVAKPGKTRTRSPRTAFYLHQRVPDIDEFSQGASGKSLGPIKFGSAAYKQLPTNYNPGIVFENIPSRRMSQRCSTALNKLEKLVKGKWPRVKLRVIAAWDKKANHKHDIHSLHYEGRAVDIMTSDRDRSKLGLLAGLAVEAGFDWVRYVKKYRVHASVRADGKRDNNFLGMGCFRSNSTVRLESGQKTTMESLKIGDKVESVNRDGQIIHSEVVMFLDNKPNEKDVLYFVIETDKPQVKLILTKSHLVYVKRQFSSVWRVQFAKWVQKGDFIKVRRDGKMVPARVSRIYVSSQRGAIAPLTNEGNVIVDGALASCYALLEDHEFANSIFWPAKALYRYFPLMLSDKAPKQGVHWYARLLLFLNDYLSILT